MKKILNGLRKLLPLIGVSILNSILNYLINQYPSLPDFPYRNEILLVLGFVIMVVLIISDKQEPQKNNLYQQYTRYEEFKNIPNYVLIQESKNLKKQINDIRKELKEYKLGIKPYTLFTKFISPLNPLAISLLNISLTADEITVEGMTVEQKSKKHIAQLEREIHKIDEELEARNKS